MPELDSRTNSSGGFQREWFLFCLMHLPDLFADNELHSNVRLQECVAQLVELLEIILTGNSEFKALRDQDDSLGWVQCSKTFIFLFSI